MLRRLHSFVIGFIVMMGLISAPAFAQSAVDPRRFADVLAAQLTAVGMPTSIGEATRDGNDIIVRDVAINFDPGSGPLRIAELRLENVRPLPNNGYMIGRIGVQAAEYAVPEGKWNVGAIVLSEILVPAIADKSSIPLYAQSFEMAPTHFTTSDGNRFVEMGRVRWVSSPFAPGRDITSTLEPFNVVIDAAEITKGDPKVLPVLKAFGITKMTGQIQANGSWKAADGRMDVTMAYGIRELGTLGYRMDISGMTVEMMRGIQDMLAKQPRPKPGEKAEKREMTPEEEAFAAELAQKLKLHAFSLRFDDASLTNKALDYYAKETGQSRQQLVAQVKTMAPFFIAMLGDAELAAQASGAIATFMDNPKALEIAVRPAASMSFMDIALSGATTPAAAIKQLNPSVTANK